jgi:hypothetical protein
MQNSKYNLTENTSFCESITKEHLAQTHIKQYSRDFIISYKPPSSIPKYPIQFIPHLKARYRKKLNQDPKWKAGSYVRQYRKPRQTTLGLKINLIQLQAAEETCLKLEIQNIKKQLQIRKLEENLKNILENFKNQNKTITEQLNQETKKQEEISKLIPTLYQQIIYLTNTNTAYITFITNIIAPNQKKPPEEVLN